MIRFKKRFRKKRRKQFFKKFFLPGLFLVIILGGLIWLLFLASPFQIKEIEILGNEKVSSEELKTIIEFHIFPKIMFFSSRTIFWLNFQKTEAEIFKNYPQIAKIDFQRRFPAKLIVRIEERKPIAIFYQKETPFFLDEQGVIFQSTSAEATVDRRDLDLVIKSDRADFALGNEAIKRESLRLILKIQRILKENLKIEIEEFFLSDKRLNTKTKEGWEIYFDLSEDVDWQLTKLSLALEKKIPQERRKELEYIDLRFGNMVYPKYAE